MTRVAWRVDKWRRKTTLFALRSSLDTSSLAKEPDLNFLFASRFTKDSVTTFSEKKRNLNHPRKNRKGGLWSVYPDGYSWDFGKKRGLQSHKYVIAYGFELFGLGRVAETPFPPPFPVEQVPELSAELLCPGMKEPIALGKSRRCFRQGRTIRRLCVPRRGYS